MTIELLQQVRTLDPISGTDQLADVLIADGYIKAVESAIVEYPAETVVQDCRGLILGPGLVDLYSHSGEPGFEERETWLSLLQAAIAGGFTRLAILPDTEPPFDNPAGLAALHRKLHSLAHTQMWPPGTFLPNLSCWGAITRNVEGQKMTDLVELATAGVVGFADGHPLSNLGLLRRVLEYLKPFDKPVALMSFDRQIASNGVAREGIETIRLGLPGNPAVSESSALAALLEVVAAIGTPVHLMRISTRRSVELIGDAKARGVPVTASTTWMHLLLSTEDLDSYSPDLHLEPPLGNPEDRAALLEGVREGIIDAIAIDHTPYTYEEKTVAFAEAPPGAIGLEFALPLLWQALVEKEGWSPLQLWQRLSTSPARCLLQPPSAVAPGQPTELVLFNPQQTWTADKHTLKSLSSNTPWLGHQIYGQVVKTWCPKPRTVENS